MPQLIVNFQSRPYDCVGLWVSMLQHTVSNLPRSA
jgi:hypothetical protein